jgi:hypothetical protein
MMPRVPQMVRPKRSASPLARVNAGEMADDAAVEAVHGGDMVAGDGPHPFAAVAQVCFRDRGDAILADDADAGIAPACVAGDETHQVENVGAEHHHVLAAGAGVFLAAATQFEDVADAAIRDQVFHALKARAVTRLVSDGELDMVLLAGRYHLVGFLQISAQRLFEKHRRPGLGTRHHHVAMQIEMPIRDADDLGTFLLQHWPIVGLAPSRF